MKKLNKVKFALKFLQIPKIKPPIIIENSVYPDSSEDTKFFNHKSHNQTCDEKKHHSSGNFDTKAKESHQHKHKSKTLDLEDFETPLNFEDIHKKGEENRIESLSHLKVEDNNKVEENLFEIKEEEEKSIIDGEKNNSIERNMNDLTNKNLFIPSNNNSLISSMSPIPNDNKKNEENENFINGDSKDDDTNGLPKTQKSAKFDNISDEILDSIKLMKYRQELRFKDVEYIIFPDDDFKIWWDIILVINLIYVATVLPFIVAFNIDTTGNSVAIIDMVSLSIFWIDIAITFFTAYFDKNEELIVTHKDIISNYVLGWLVFDFITAFPFSFIIFQRFNDYVVSTSKIINLIGLIRILKVFKERSRMMQYLQVWTRIRPGMETIFFTITTVLVFMHIAACFWHIIADINMDDPTNWIYSFSYYGSSNQDIYVASLYFVMQTVVTVGYGDLHPCNTIERLISLVLMCVGAFIYSLNVGTLSNLLANLDSKEASFQEKMNTLIKIKNNYGIDNNLYNRIKRALKYGHKRTDEERHHFLNELPINLRIELSHIMHKHIVVGIDFFKNKHPRFIAFIGPLLKPLKVGKGEYIFMAGEYANEMYFIKSGSVSMVIEEFDDFQFMTVKQGYYFGEVDLLFGETRTYTYMAGRDSDCELLCLTKKDFKKIFFHEFHDIGIEIYNTSFKRKQRAEEIYNQAYDYCEKVYEAKTKDDLQEPLQQSVSIKYDEILNEGDSVKNANKSLINTEKQDNNFGSSFKMLNDCSNDLMNDVKKVTEEEEDHHYIATMDSNITPTNTRNKSRRMSETSDTSSKNGKKQMKSINVNSDKISFTDIVNSHKEEESETKKIPSLLSNFFKRNSQISGNSLNLTPKGSSIFDQNDGLILNSLGNGVKTKQGENDIFDKFKTRLDKVEDSLNQALSIFEGFGLVSTTNESDLKASAMKQKSNSMDNTKKIEGTIVSSSSLTAANGSDNKPEDKPQTKEKLNFARLVIQEKQIIDKKRKSVDVLAKFSNKK